MTVLDMEVMRQFYSDMAKADEVTFDPDMTHDELAQSIASTSGIENQNELVEFLFNYVILGIGEAVAGSEYANNPEVIAKGIAHVGFELGYKMGLYVSTQKPD